MTAGAALRVARSCPRGSTTLPAGRSPAARRQRRLSARRLRLSAPPSGARHPLPRSRAASASTPTAARPRYGPGGAWYETGPDAGVRASRRRSAQPLHSRDDPAARADRAKARSSTSTRPTRTSRACSSTRSSPTRRSHDRRSSSAMYSATIGPSRYAFPISRRCWPRPRRCAAATCSPASRRASGEERVAAQYALADLPLATFLSEHVVPYESDEVTRLIVDSHDRAAFAADRASHRRRIARLAAVGRGDHATRSPRSRPASRPRWRRR